MTNILPRCRTPYLVGVLILLALTKVGSAQVSAPLLRMQISSAELQMEVHRQGMGNNINDIAKTDNPRDVMQYPNTGSCVFVYENGSYVFQKREERTVGQPKIKVSEGVLTSEEMQRLRDTLDSEELKKIKTPPAPDLPLDTEAIREIERLDVQINHAGAVQRFTTIKERVKTNGQGLVSSAPSNGADTFLDNGASYRKTLSPLVKWFGDFGKKNKSGLKDSKREYCEQ